MPFKLPSYSLIATILRGLQLFLSVLNLGLAAGVIADISGYYGRAVYVLIVTIFTLIYEGFVLFKPALKLLSPLVSLIVESVLFVFWLAAFAVIANDIGSLDCEYTSFYYNTHYSFTWCKVGKALIAFSVIEWITFIVSLVLLIVFTIAPLTKAGGFNDLLISDIFTFGGIFINDTDTPTDANAKDLEKGQEVAEGGESSINHPPVTDEGITINESNDANPKIEEDSLEGKPSNHT